MTVRILLDTIGRPYVSRAKSPPCQQCAEPIKRRGTEVKYCSRFCFFRSRQGSFPNRKPKLPRKVSFVCGTCGKDGALKASAIRVSGNFCSRACATVCIVEKTRLRGFASPTSIETLLYNCLASHGVEFEKQHRIGRFIADAYIPSVQTVIEVDGDYWHSLAHNQERDRRKDAALGDRGIRVVRITEREAHADIHAALVRSGICR